MGNSQSKLPPPHTLVEPKEQTFEENNFKFKDTHLGCPHQAHSVHVRNTFFYVKLTGNLKMNQQNTCVELVFLNRPWLIRITHIECPFHLHTQQKRSVDFDFWHIDNLCCLQCFRISYQLLECLASRQKRRRLRWLCLVGHFPLFFPFWVPNLFKNLNASKTSTAYCLSVCSFKSRRSSKDPSMAMTPWLIEKKNSCREWSQSAKI